MGLNKIKTVQRACLPIERIELSREATPNLSVYTVGNKYPYVFFLHLYTMLSVLVMVLEPYPIYQPLNGYLHVTRGHDFYLKVFPSCPGSYGVL
jgi:hypothetical protein